MVDAVGGVDIKVKKTLKDPSYDGYGLGEKGFTLTKGTHHLDGAEALAYARIRKAARRERLHPRRPPAADPRRAQGAGDERREHPLGAARGSWRPSARPSRPTSRPYRLPDLAAIMDEMAPKAVTRAVINHPLVDTQADPLRRRRWSPTSRRSRRWPRSSSRPRAQARCRGRRRSRRPSRPVGDAAPSHPAAPSDGP